MSEATVRELSLGLEEANTTPEPTEALRTREEPKESPFSGFLATERVPCSADDPRFVPLAPDPLGTQNPVCDFLAVAMNHASHGIRVFPICRLDYVNKDGEANSSGKRPAIRKWQRRATTHYKAIQSWAKQFPTHGVGLCMSGYPNHRLVAFDIDGQNGLDCLAEIERIAGCKFPVSMVTRSPKDPTHLHMVYRVPAGIVICIGSLPGIDVKGWGGQIVAPGSPSKHGGYYIRERGPEALVELPQAIIDALLTYSKANKPEKGKSPFTVTTEEEIQRKEERWIEEIDDEGYHDRQLDFHYQNVIDSYEPSVGKRHIPMIEMVASLRCKALSDSEIRDIVVNWLRHYEGHYGLPIEQAIGELDRYLSSERTIKPYVVNSLQFGITDNIQRLIADLTDNPRDRLLLEVVFREFALDRARGNDELTMTNRQITSGYEMLAGRGISKRDLSTFKKRFFDMEHRATTQTLFVRTLTGFTGTPSKYSPSAWLMERLTQQDLAIISDSDNPTTLFEVPKPFPSPFISPSEAMIGEGEEEPKQGNPNSETTNVGCTSGLLEKKKPYQRKKDNFPAEGEKEREKQDFAESENTLQDIKIPPIEEESESDEEKLRFLEIYLQLTDEEDLEAITTTTQEIADLKARIGL